MSMENAKRERQIATQLNRLRKAIEDLGCVVGTIDERLVPILRKEELGKDVGEPQQELVPMADSIREEAQRVEQLTEKLRHILSCLEL